MLENRPWSLLFIVIETDQGVFGVGEALARHVPTVFSSLIDNLLAPKIIGMDPFHVEAIWQKLYRSFSGRSGGVLIEAISAIDIALWDIMGKEVGRPVSDLLGSMGRKDIRAYASTIHYGGTDDEAAKKAQDLVSEGFRAIKVKTIPPVASAQHRVRVIREAVGPEIELYSDSSWSEVPFTLQEALMLGETLVESGYVWYEEPLIPEDLEGYKYLAAHLPVRLVAGESEHTAVGISPLITSRTVGLVQPDVTRSGGISETRKIANIAAAHHVEYSPHVGGSGGVCVAAGMHLAAALPNFHSFECMAGHSAFRDDLFVAPIPTRKDIRKDGTLPAMKAPGLGIELDMAKVEKLTVTC